MAKRLNTKRPKCWICGDHKPANELIAAIGGKSVCAECDEAVIRKKPGKELELIAASINRGEYHVPDEVFRIMDKKALAREKRKARKRQERNTP